MTDIAQPVLPPEITRGIINSIHDAILTVDHQGRITSFNPEAEKLFGLPAADLIGETFAETFLLMDGLEDFCDCVVRTIHDATHDLRADLTLMVNGHTRHVHFRGGLLREADGSASLGVVIVVADVSERIQFLEDQARRERERLAMGQFIVAILGVFSVFALLLEPMQELAQAQFFDFGPVVALIALMVIAFLITRWTGSSLKDYGLLFVWSWSEARLTILWSIAFCLVMTVGKALSIHFGAEGEGTSEPLFSFLTLDDGTVVRDGPTFLLALAIYLFSIVFQQFAMRCAIQAPLTRFLDGTVTRPALLANVTTTLLFAVLHAHLNPLVSLLVIGPSLLWGWLFIRCGTVVFPILSHVIIGVYAIFILGLFAGLNQV